MKSVPRLVEYFLPKSYEITLSLHRKARAFRGTVTISGHKAHSTSPLMLHAKDLAIQQARLDGQDIHVTPRDFDGLELGHDIPAGDHVITLEFSGKITNTMHGLYPCYYQQNDEPHELLMTQFESHHAREVFPCIDEPEAKATFQLSLEVEPDVMALSNTPVAQHRQTSTHQVYEFEPSPHMSTYLLAFVVGDLHHVSHTTSRGTQVSVYATRVHTHDKLRFALDAATRSIEFFEDYFGVAYPLAKSDHVAVPDFSAGAMENWGLITYRERALLVDESSSQTARELAATVICHEVSHQWFGNLVTMKWWDDLWLNESFANLMEYIAVDALYPTWNIWLDYAAKEISLALNRDSIAGVQPVKTVVHHPDEIGVLFDPAIVYAKGGRLLRMLREFIGEQAFRSGLRDYFTTHAYSNTSSADLWRAFERHTEKNVVQLMDAWLRQSGFPQIAVHTTETGYRLQQSRLLIGGHDTDQLWPVPLAARQPDFPELMTTKTLKFDAKHQLPLLNQQSVTHSVTVYDHAALSLVMDALDTQRLDTLDRIGLLFEYALLARAGTVPATELVRILSHYTDETEQSVWSVISYVITELKRYITSESDSELVALYLTELAAPLYQSLGTVEQADDTDAQKKLRAMVCLLLSDANYPPVVEQLLHIGSKGLSTLGGEMRVAVYAAMAQHGSRDDFAALLALHHSTTDAQARQDAADALTSTRDSDHIALLLNQLTDKSRVKPQDVVRWFTLLMRNPYARDACWAWMTHHWHHIAATYSGDKLYEAFPRYAANAMNTEQEYRQFADFFEPKQHDVALRRVVEIGLHELKHRSTLLAEQHDDVIQAIRDTSRLSQ